MFSLPACINNHFNRIIVAILLFAIPGCSSQMNSTISVSPENFKVHIPFILNDNGIVINTYWGSEKRHYVLSLDNNSPSWIKRSEIKFDKSFIQSGQRFKTSTADGTPIKGDVGICDSLTFENITFRKIPFYIMPGNFKADTTDVGVFGGDLMSHGVWKIDFIKNEITFASNIDSIKGINPAEVIPADFGKKDIKIGVSFKNDIAIMMAIDLGYIGDILLPPAEFNRISTPNKILLRTAMFRTPASENMVTSLSFLDTVRINKNPYRAVVSTNEKVKERLIGLRFFQRFDFVIFDYINKQIYLPKKSW